LPCATPIAIPYSDARDPIAGTIGREPSQIPSKTLPLVWRSVCETGEAFVMTVFQDLRYAVRTAWRDRGFSFIALLTLALGIGANTALFTIVNAVVLAPLPFRDPAQLVRVTVDFTRQPVRDVGLSVPELFDLRGSGLFEDVAGMWPISANLTETDEPERVETALVDANYFSMLGVGAGLGRVFDTTDAQPGIAEVAVISDALWKRRFGADAHVLGKRIRIDNDMYSIIGVAPPAFRHPGRGTATDVERGRQPAGWPRRSRRNRSGVPTFFRVRSDG